MDERFYDEYFETVIPDWMDPQQVRAVQEALSRV